MRLLCVISVCVCVCCVATLFGCRGYDSSTHTQHTYNTHTHATRSTQTQTRTRPHVVVLVCFEGMRATHDAHFLYDYFCVDELGVVCFGSSGSYCAQSIAFWFGAEGECLSVSMYVQSLHLEPVVHVVGRMTHPWPSWYFPRASLGLRFTPQCT